MKTWSEIANIQPLASKIITNSLQKQRISHAYLFHGERGTGKEAIALFLVKCLFCEHMAGVEPCHECRTCKRIASRNYPDVHWIEPDGASIKKEQIDHLQKEFGFSGMESNRKVYIIKDADTLTVNAANRLLKFLEEPAMETTAIMLTENSQSIIPTIRSRCQIIDFAALNPQHFQQQLMNEGIPKHFAALIGALTNNLDEAMSLYKDEWFANARILMVQLIEVFLQDKEDAFLFIHSKWLPHFKERTQQEQGFDLLLLAFKDILYYQIDYKEGLVVFTNDNELPKRAAMYFSYRKLLRILQAILEAKRKLKQNVHPTLVIEQLALRIER